MVRLVVSLLLNRSAASRLRPVTLLYLARPRQIQRQSLVPPGAKITLMEKIRTGYRPRQVLSYPRTRQIREPELGRRPVAQNLSTKQSGRKWSACWKSSMVT